jgi:hypothetical protein
MKDFQRNFLWQVTNSAKKWALVSWNTLYLPKLNGILGLRDPEIINSTLAAKTWWRWIQNKGEL